MPRIAGTGVAIGRPDGVGCSTGRAELHAQTGLLVATWSRSATEHRETDHRPGIARLHLGQRRSARTAIIVYLEGGSPGREPASFMSAKLRSRREQAAQAGGGIARPVAEQLHLVNKAGADRHCGCHSRLSERGLSMPALRRAGEGARAQAWRASQVRRARRHGTCPGLALPPGSVRGAWPSSPNAAGEALRDLSRVRADCGEGEHPGQAATGPASCCGAPSRFEAKSRKLTKAHLASLTDLKFDVAAAQESHARAPSGPPSQAAIARDATPSTRRAGRSVSWAARFDVDADQRWQARA